MGLYCACGCWAVANVAPRRIKKAANEKLVNRVREIMRHSFVSNMNAHYRTNRLVCYGLTRSTSGIGRSGGAVAISRLKRRVVPSNVQPPSLQREAGSIGFPSRTRTAKPRSMMATLDPSLRDLTGLDLR